MMIYPAKVSYKMMRIAFPAPTLSMSPYIPDHTYAKASQREMIIANNF